MKFAPPFAAEVQLYLHTYIRSDVVVQPGGAVRRGRPGTAAQQVLAVSYAGRNDWQNPAGSSVPTRTSRPRRSRPAAPGLVDYNVVVKLKDDAPPGYIQDQLVLVTNDYDPKAAHVPVAIEGLVATALVRRRFGWAWPRPGRRSPATSWSAAARRSAFCRSTRPTPASNARRPPDRLPITTFCR